MQELSKIYRARNANPKYRERVWGVLCRSFFQRYVKCTDTVLDLGCGWGVFINNIICRRKIGMDLNPDANERLHNGTYFIKQDCSKPWKLNNLDLVFSSNFFEHLPNQKALMVTLAEAHRCLKPGGKLITMGPNIVVCHGRYWSVIDHYLPLSNLSLAEAMRLSGFTVIECRAQFLPLTMNDGKEFPMWMIWIYLKLPILWRLFGEQFLIVATK